MIDPEKIETAITAKTKAISIELNLLSLEEALKRSQNVGLDFLSLDVQGTKYDILEGAKDFLLNNCIGIQLEVEFVKLYQDQKTFLTFTLC